MARKNSNRSTNKRKNGGKQKGKSKKNGGGNREMKKIAPSVDDLALIEQDASLKIWSQQRAAGPEVKRTEVKISSNHRDTGEAEKNQGHTMLSYVLSQAHLHRQPPKKVDDSYTSPSVAETAMKYLGPKAKRGTSTFSLATKYESNASHEEGSDSNTSKTDDSELESGIIKSTALDQNKKPLVDKVNDVTSFTVFSSPEEAEETATIDLEPKAPVDCVTFRSPSYVETSMGDTNKVCAPFFEDEIEGRSNCAQVQDLKESGIISKSSVSPRSLVSVVTTVTNESDCQDTSATGKRPKSNEQTPISRSSSFSSWSEVDDLKTHASDMEDLIADDWNAIPAWS